MIIKHEKHIDHLQHKGTMSTKPVFKRKLQRHKGRMSSYVEIRNFFVLLTLAHTMTIIDKISTFYNNVNKTVVVVNQFLGAT